MARVFIGLILLMVAFALIVSRRHDAANSANLAGMIQHHAIEASGEGSGFQDGAVVFATFDDQRITIEQLPSLKGRLRGVESTTGFFVDELTWYGVSLREAIGHCLDVDPALVTGDERLDSIWLDVNAARSHGPFSEAMEGWDEFTGSVLSGLEQAYGLTVVEGRSSDQVLTVEVRGVPRSPLDPVEPRATQDAEPGPVPPVSGKMN